MFLLSQKASPSGEAWSATLQCLTYVMPSGNIDGMTHCWGAAEQDASTFGSGRSILTQNGAARAVLAEATSHCAVTRSRETGRRSYETGPAVDLGTAIPLPGVSE